MAQEQSALREGHTHASSLGGAGRVTSWPLLSRQDGVDAATLGAGPGSTDPPGLSLSGTREAVFCFCRSRFTGSGLSLLGAGKC